jgi:hypothetical protein
MTGISPASRMSRLEHSLRRVLTDTDSRRCRFPPDVLQAAASASAALEAWDRSYAGRGPVVTAARALIGAGRSYGLVTGIYWPDLEYQIEKAA